MFRKKQILVVDDDSLNRAMLSEILSDEYQVLEANKGQEALDILIQNKDDIALVITDITKSVMDGFSLMKRMKADVDLAKIPIAVMTRNDSEVDEVDALAHGATDFIPKSCNPQIILHRIANVINLRETESVVNQFKYDRLTGFYSKEFFYQRVREQLRKHPEIEYTIICSNIENFKLYNDMFGIPAGDSLLKDMADLLKNAIGKDAIFGRLRADRFVCLKEKTQEYKDRIAFTADKQSAIAQKIKNVVMKCGVYQITDKSMPVERMCDRAVLAVDSIKGQYNNFVAVYDDMLRAKRLREHSITDTMDTALAEGQFVVYFQPKYSLNDKALAGAEALVRWVHPKLGFISPSEFIPLFEKNGFITKLDQFVWKKVCEKLCEWQKGGYLPVPVSVNVSRADFYQLDLADTLLEMVNKYGIEPAQLHLEITESAYMENSKQIIDMVEQLRKLGFIVEMDDFGSGYSSLSMFSQMKLDILKLDMKFVQNETSKPVEQNILRFIIDMAHWMNLSVVAEGVETREQMERLSEFGCDYVQGYFLAKPMPEYEFEKMMKLQPSNHKELFPKQLKQDDADIKGILLVDEDSEYRKRVCKTFEGKYRVFEADNVERAIELITEKGRDAVSAVILSVALPDNGAVSFMKFLRQNPLLWQIPVLATIQWGESMEEFLPEFDTDDLLCKRHPQSDLCKRVDRMLRLAAYRERECMFKDEASRDFLTGLLNRRGFQTAMDSLRNEDLPLALYFFDLDNLKKVNDTYGHDAGDQMLRAFSTLIRSNTRSDDILCRYGGDEFVVILKRISDADTVLKKGNDICRLFQDHLLADHLHAACTAGIALCGIDEKPSAKLIDRADNALYNAKRNNKGSCLMWNNDNE